MEIIGGSNSGKRIKDSGELLTEAGIEWPVSVQELYPGLIKKKSKSWYPYPPYYTETRVPIPQYSSNLEEFENEPYKAYEPLICHSADFPDPDNLSDYNDDNVVVPEGLDPVYYKKTRRDSVALDRYLAILRRKRDEAGPEDPSEKELGLIKMNSNRWHPYPPCYTVTSVLSPQYSSNLEEFENEPYNDYKPITYVGKDSADFPDPDNLSDYDDDSVVVPEGLDPVYYKKTRRDSVALDRFLAKRRRKRAEAGPVDLSEKELYYAGTGTQMPVSDQAFQLNWATPCTGERRADDYGADFTIFVGNLARDVTDYVLQETFRAHYTSVKGAKVVTDRITGLSKGYGFVRFMDEAERARAMVEMNGAFCSSRPMRIGPAATKKPVGCQQYYEKVPYQSAQDPTMYCSGYPGYGSYQQAHQGQGNDGYGQGAGYGCTAPPQVPNMYSSGYPGYGSYHQAHQGQDMDRGQDMYV